MFQVPRLLLMEVLFLPWVARETAEEATVLLLQHESLVNRFPLLVSANEVAIGGLQVAVDEQQSEFAELEADGNSSLVCKHVANSDGQFIVANVIDKRS